MFNMLKNQLEFTSLCQEKKMEQYGLVYLLRFK